MPNIADIIIPVLHTGNLKFRKNKITKSVSFGFEPLSSL